MLCFALGLYYGCVLGFLTAITWKHWESLYEPETDETGVPERTRTIWRRDGGP